MPHGPRYGAFPSTETGRFSVPHKETAYLKRKQFLAEYKLARGCTDCKLPGPDVILTFDHVRGEKKFGIGQRWDIAMSRLLEELAKCEVVCFNCHMLREHVRRGGTV